MHKAGVVVFLGVGWRRQAEETSLGIFRMEDHRQEWGGSDHKLFLECPLAGDNTFTLERRNQVRQAAETATFWQLGMHCTREH